MLRRVISTFTVLFSFFILGYGQDHIIKIDENSTDIFVWNVEYLADEDQSLNFEDLLNPSIAEKFGLYFGDPTTLSSDTKVYWVKLTVQNQMPKDQEWVLDFGIFSYIEMREVKDNVILKDVWKTGRLVPFHDRNYPVANSSYIHQIIPGGGAKTYFIRLDGSGAQSYSFGPAIPNFRLARKDIIDNSNADRRLWIGVFAAILLFMLVYHIFVFVSTKERSYSYYLGLIFAYFYLTLNNSGYIVSILSFWENFPIYQSKFELFVLGSTGILTLLFTRELLKTKERLPKWDKVIKILLWANVIVVAGEFIYYPIFGPLAPIEVTASLLALVTIGVIASIKRIPSAIFYLVAYIFSIIGALILMLTFLGVFQFTDFNLYYAAPLGWLLEILFFSFAIANIINILKKKNELNQIRYIEQLKENDALQTKVNRELEQKVAERTLEINKQKEIIEQEKFRAEESERIKEQFLANMSHEIRTPMHAISGMVKILERNKHYPEQAVFLDAMHKSSDNLVVLLNDILDLSKIDAGMLEIEKEPIAPRDVINNVFQILQYKADEKGLLFDFEVAEDVPEWVIGDSTRLSQILTNLAGNAIKFTEKGGVKIKLTRQDDTLQYEIRDTGIGIPADKIQKIFNAFEQAEGSITRRFGGTGLGLSISRQLVEAQEGKIWVESEVEKGSSFFISLPLITGTGDSVGKQKLSEEKLLELGAKLKGTRILLAEDNNFNQMIANDDLRYYIKDLSIETVENGALAYAEAQTGKYDLILMDVQMPEMDGLEASQKIRAWEKENNKPPILIIAMTASLLETEVNQCLDAGMNNYIPKPYRSEELIGTLFKELKG